MPMRSSSLANNPLAITRELDGRYDVVLQVRDNLDLIEQVAGIDFSAILAELESAQDFTGITVVQGETVAWDSVNKILTVPKGDKGDKGDTGLIGPQGAQGIQGPQGIKGDTGLKGDTGSQGPKGFDGAAGAQGLKGDTGDDLTITQITHNGNGTFNWLFSDGTTYMTPDLKGPKGDIGDQGIKGDQGISVHHLKGTSTTNPNGDFGTSPFRDTYTFYGDADETLNLGWFVVTNGVSDGMSSSVYDVDGNGIVDNSERLGGELPSYYVNVVTDQIVAGSKTFAGNVVVQGDLTVSGNAVSVDVETVTVKDNLIVLNNGEVGAGVTAGEAGIVVDRGTADDYKFVFTEADDSFKIGTTGSLQKVATREDTPLDNGVAVWDSATAKFETTRNVDVSSVSYNGLGTTSWNADESTLDVVLPGATLQVGQETLVKVRAGVAITNGKVVMATGSLGNSGRIVVGLHDGTRGNGKRVVGVATQDIANGADGLVTSFGKVRNINTTGTSVGEVWADGDLLYIKPNGVGSLTKVVPLDTEINMPVAFVVHAHTNGTLFVRINGVDENLVKDWVDSKYVPRPVSSSNRLVKFTGTTGTVGDSNLISNAGGDLGLNVAPSAWHSSVRALETQGGSVFTVNDTAFRSVQNAYLSVGNYYVYKTTAAATLYNQEGGEHKWSTAPSGTGGTSVTFTERMKVDNGGNLTVAGTISSNGVIIGTLAEFTAALG